MGNIKLFTEKAINWRILFGEKKTLEKLSMFFNVQVTIRF